MTVRSALVQLRARAILVGLEPRASPSLPSIYERTGCFCTNQAALGDEASLYEEKRRCGRAGEVLSREGNQENEDATYNDWKNGPLSYTRRVA